MKKNYICLAFIVICLSLACFSYDGFISAVSGIEQGIEITDYDPGEIVLSINTDGIFYKNHIREKTTYAEIYLEDGSVYGEYGDPQMPVFYKLIQIPESAGYEISYSLGKEIEIDLLVEAGADFLYPVQPSLRKTPDGKEGKFQINRSAYNSKGYLPEQIIIVNEEIRARGKRLLPLTIFPVRYNPASERLLIYTHIELKIQLTGSDMDRTSQLASRYQSDFSVMYDAVSLGHEQLSALGKPKGFSDEGILIISADALFSGLSSFVEWKEKKGYRVTHTMQSDIASGTTTAGIKNYIQNAYDNWAIPPSSIILVGDSNTIPTFSGGSSSSAADVYYVYLDGSDYFPDAGISRISVRTLDQLSTYLGKLLYYEQHQNPNISWMDDAALVAGHDSSYYYVGEGTLNWLASTYLDPLGWYYDKLYAVTYSSTRAQILDSLNAGKVLANYTAHCDTGEWSFKSGHYITNSHVHALTNQNMYFFAVGNCCLSGRFNTVDECIAEAFIRANNAAFAYWGASNYSYWGEDDILAKRSYTGLFENNMYKLDQNVNYAKIQLWNHYSGGGMSRYYMDMYNLFGDGTSFIPQKAPVAPVVNAPDSVSTGTSSFQVNVSASGSPLAGALVSAYNPSLGVRGTARTDSSGNAGVVLDSPVNTEGSFLLLVTHPNLINYEKTINIGSGGGGEVPVFRFFNNVRGGHLYTASEVERDYIMENLPQWQYEGAKFSVHATQASGTTAVYRFFNTITGIHFYTISEAERDNVMQLPQYNYEGIKFYVYSTQASGSIPVYRFFNHARGGHLYTISEAERDSVMQLPNWTYEGVSFYVLGL